VKLSHRRFGASDSLRRGDVEIRMGNLEMPTWSTHKITIFGGHPDHTCCSSGADRHGCDLPRD
jgi:hypothetical protein